MDLFNFKSTKRGDSYIVPFPGAMGAGGFHISLHGSAYGMHLKVSAPPCNTVDADKIR